MNTVEAECAYEGGCATENENSCGPANGGGPKYNEGINGWFKDLFDMKHGFDLVSFITTLFDFFNYL